MRKTYKYIISFIIISTLCVGGITCNAAIISQDIGADQFAIILGLSDFSYVTHMSGYLPTYLTSTTNTGVDIFVRYDQSVSLNYNDYAIRIPLYLTGIETGVMQFCFGSSSAYIDNFTIDSYTILVDGVSTTYTDGLEYLGKIGNVTLDGGTAGNSSADVYFKLWQVTWSGDVDLITFNLANTTTGVSAPFVFGLTGASFLGADVQMSTIVSQITNISQGIEQLKIYVDQVESNQITIIGKIEDVIDALSSIEDLKDQMDQILSTEAFDQANGTTIVQDIQVNNSKQVTVLNDLRQYSNTINQYHNETLITDVDSVLNQTENVVLQAVQFGSTVTTGLISALRLGSIDYAFILAGVFGVSLISYILFGKKA